MSNPVPLRRPSRLAIFSVVALVLSWTLIYIARMETTTAIDPGTVNAMIALLWVGAALTLAGLVLAVLALRRGDGSPAVALSSLFLNAFTVTFFVVVGWLAILIGI